MLPPRALADALTSLWTKQLYREYDQLSFLHGLRRVLRRAALAVEPIRHYGAWVGPTRTIVLADHLIRDYPWSVVLEILKHEMAHQYADEVLGRHGQGPHGDAFAQACRVLGVAPWAATASGALPETLAPTGAQLLSEEEERLLRRAEKLLALAGSNNEHEAQLAMQRAQELFTRHNLEVLRSRRGAAMTSTLVRLGRSKVFTHEKLIVSLLVEHFFVYIVIIEDFDARTCTSSRALDVMGAPENVAMAEYVFHFLRRAADDLWVQHRSLHDGAHKTSFQRGIINGFSQKLRGAGAAAKAAADSGLQPSTATALIAAGRTHIEDTIGQQRHPKTTRRTSSGGRFDHGSFAAGENEGRRIVLHKGVGGDARNEGRLLTGKK